MMTKVICLELVDWHFPSSPVTFNARTATACNALRCSCLEWADGPMIAGYPSCHVCSHTKASHKPKSAARKVKR